MEAGQEKGVDASAIERVVSPEDDLRKNHQDYTRIDVCVHMTACSPLYTKTGFFAALSSCYVG